ncbi:MAG: hypothetical protein ACR2PL_22950 [Dehalococcoidia bacterium]
MDEEREREDRAVRRIGDAIAKAMAYREAMGLHFDLDDARCVNEKKGWTFDIRWGGVDEGARRLTIERGWRLSEADLARAFAHAVELRQRQRPVT